MGMQQTCTCMVLENDALDLRNVNINIKMVLDVDLVDLVVKL